ncbi:hypothetical protein NA57DRAFT_65474 [Rhizodiscina lignyota]|uniref:Fe2OG dioxygenase domain-containing protein n=1 Tax=Rhizodiscina lignyota TaxID=1504668 RepID=A0A9P4IHG2_9PEZI|nr:hypothetical protein NA57DRAFT_65474 [Rhizodiscina lignyota]
MSSLLDLLTQKQPQFQTHQALVVLDLQNDFLQPEGKLPVSSRSNFISRIKRLVPTFRDNAGDIIWVRSVYEKDRPANDGTDEAEVIITEVEGVASPEESSEEVATKEASSPSHGSKSSGRAFDLLKKMSRKTSAPPEPTNSPKDDPEHFLSATARRQPACMPNTKGAELSEDVRDTIDRANDIIVNKSYYSAFNSTSLLLTLRTRLITELYICGCMTNLSVYATALDAARHGLTINIVEDCLGYRKATRHREALRQMADIMGAYTVTSTELLTELEEQDPDFVAPHTKPPIPDGDALNDMVQKLRLSDSSAHGSKSERPSTSGSTEEPTLRRSRSGKLQKKPPSAQAEESEHTLKYKRSRIRMRKRDQSAGPGPRDSMAVLDRPDKTAPLPEAAKRANKPPQLPAAARRSVEEPVPSPLLSPPPTSSRNSELSNNRVSAVSAVSRDGSTEQSSRRSSRSRGSDRGSGNQSPLQPASPVTTTPAEKTEAAKAELLSPTVGPPSAIPHRGSNDSIAAKSLAPSIAKSTTSSLSAHKPDVDYLCERDSYLCTSVLPPQLSTTIFQDLYNEVRWQIMYHQTGSVPRLVCNQGQFGRDGSMPVYRHPTDHALPLLHFSPAVQLVRHYAEKIVQHPLNHVLIQLYRNGQDYISEHSDKTLDIMRGSSIVNVSFGAQRTMRLRTKKSALNQQSISFAEAARQTQRIRLPHNSAFILGQDTNMRWLHGINADKRAAKDRSDAEKAFSGMRISLTFRNIGTFLNSDSTLIWGQGASGKTRENARPVVSNDMLKTEAMVRAFGKENQTTEFDWSEIYGAGFDILHFRKVPSDNPSTCLLFLSNDAIENGQVVMYLDEAGIEYAAIETPTKESDDKMGCMRKVCFRDSDPLHTEVTGALAVLLYLDRLRPLPHRITADGADEKPAVDGVRRGEKWLLPGIEGYLQDEGYVAGRGFGFADCAYFPVLERCWEGWVEERDGEVPRVRSYLERMRKRGQTRKTRERESREELRRQMSVGSLPGSKK